MKETMTEKSYDRDEDIRDKMKQIIKDKHEGKEVVKDCELEDGTSVSVDYEEG